MAGCCDPSLTGGPISFHTGCEGHTIFKSTYLRAPEELWVQPTIGDTTGEVYKPLGPFLRYSRGSGCEIDGVNFSPPVK